MGRGFIGGWGWERGDYGWEGAEKVADEACLVFDVAFFPGFGVEVFFFGEALAAFGDGGEAGVGVFAELEVFHFVFVDGDAAGVIGNAEEGGELFGGLVGEGGDFEGGALDELLGAFGPGDFLAVLNGEEFGEVLFVVQE